MVQRVSPPKITVEDSSRLFVTVGDLVNVVHPWLESICTDKANLLARTSRQRGFTWVQLEVIAELEFPPID